MSFLYSNRCTWGVKSSEGEWLASCVMKDYADEVLRENPGSSLVSGMSAWDGLPVGEVPEVSEVSDE